MYVIWVLFFDTKNLLELKESPFDKGKEVFKQLYKEAVWI